MATRKPKKDPRLDRAEEALRLEEEKAARLERRMRRAFTAWVTSTTRVRQLRRRRDRLGAEIAEARARERLLGRAKPAPEEVSLVETVLGEPEQTPAPLFDGEPEGPP